MGAETGGLPPRQTLPPPSPTWAEVAGGGVERSGRPAVRAASRAFSSRHAPRTAPPSATTQFESWLLCRRDGIPAKLVLETDGESEEVTLWFRRAPCAPTQPPPPRRRRQRPRRNRERRKREAEGQKTAPAPAAAETAVVAAAASEIGASPPSGSPPAKRPRTRAAAREGGRQDLPTPEISRASGEASPCALDISYGEDLFARRDASPSPPPSTPPTPAPPPLPTTPSTPTPLSFAAEVRDYLYAWAAGGYDEGELEEAVRGWGGWRSVNDVIFPVLPSIPMKCRFCKALDRNLGYDDDLCMEMDDHCGNCTMADDIDTVKNFAFRFCDYPDY